MSEVPGGGNKNDVLENYAFDPTGQCVPPPLRPPALSQAQLLAAIELGFSNKYLPSEVSSGVRNGGASYIRQPSSEFGSFSPGEPTGVSNSNQYNQYIPAGDCTDGQQVNYSTGEESDGLLPPLRRPHINEIPPDVLAVLLKTARFEEILGPLQRQQNHPNNMADSHSNTDRRSPSDQSRMSSRNTHNNNQSPQPPRQQSITPERTFSGTPPRNPNQRTQLGASADSSQRSNNSSSSGRGITLSPMAKEFHPARQQQRSGPAPNMTIMNSQEEAELAEAVAQFQMQSQSQEQIDFSQGAYASQQLNDDNSDCILSTVTDAITDLTSHPANFTRCAKAVTDVLKNYLSDADTLGIVVTLLVEQSILNPNFCYSGARLSQVLHKNAIAVGNTTFKNLLLARCQEEFTVCVANIDTDPEIQARCRGLLMFFGELFMNMKIDTTAGGSTAQAPFTVLGLGVLEIMQRLVKEPGHDNIKCIFQVLKLVGWELENSTDVKIKPVFEQLMKDLSYLCLADKTIKPQTKNLLDTLFDLKNRKWNREEVLEETTSASPASTFSSTQSNNIYELPDSDEENYDDDECIMLDDEPEEVQRAYEEFLKTTKK